MDIISLDERRIKKMGEQYNLTCKVYGNNRTIHVTSHTSLGREDWMVEVGNGEVILKHENKGGNRTKKNHYHSQRKFRKLEHCFDSINNHKPRFKKFTKVERMKELFEQLH